MHDYHQMRFGVQAKGLSGKAQFPLLVDPNTGKQMLESDAIISYLWNEYGDGQVHSTHVSH